MRVYVCLFVCLFVCKVLISDSMYEVLNNTKDLTATKVNNYYKISKKLKLSKFYKSDSRIWGPTAAGLLTDTQISRIYGVNLIFNFFIFFFFCTKHNQSKTYCTNYKFVLLTVFTSTCIKSTR